MYSEEQSKRDTAMGRHSLDDDVKLIMSVSLNKYRFNFDVKCKCHPVWKSHGILQCSSYSIWSILMIFQLPLVCSNKSSIVLF